MIGWSRIRRLGRRFQGDQRGASAVEFALIGLFFMLPAYLGTAELSLAMLTQRRISHAASALGDLAAQPANVTKASLGDTLNAASIIVQPFSTGPLQLRLTSVTMQSNGKATVDWSQSLGGGIAAYSKSTAITDPKLLSLVPNTGNTIIMSEAKYLFASPVPFILKNGIPFSDVFYLEPRSGSPIACADC